MKDESTQTYLELKPYSRGFHLITSQIETLLLNYNLKIGTINVFIQHTSAFASLSINENVDSSVRKDMEIFYSDITDDMPAHIKSSILGQSLTISITEGRLNLGTWHLFW